MSEIQTGCTGAVLGTDTWTDRRSVLVASEPGCTGAVPKHEQIEGGMVQKRHGVRGVKIVILYFRLETISNGEHLNGFHKK